MSIHVCQGVNRRYLVRTRNPYQKRYTMHGKPSRSFTAAVKRLAIAMIDQNWGEGNVAFVDDYYDPSICFEMRLP